MDYIYYSRKSFVTVNLLRELGLGEVSELCLQASLIQFTFDQKPERRPPQMARAATEWKLLAVVSGFAMLLWLAVIQFVRSDSFLPLSLALALSLCFSLSLTLSPPTGATG